mmetsp:Transcript_8426/g.20828  ORF Transcript_8426/g.20828 Transcript_8426/m.20828 type:complete len:189 (-) Transcript_8426:228-794(-)
MQFCFRPTMTCLRKARVTIPKLSPTHTRAKILKFCPPGLLSPNPSTNSKSSGLDSDRLSSVYLECTDALFVLECSPDLITEGFREQTDDGTDVNPVMIVESHDEGDFVLVECSSSSSSSNTTSDETQIRLGEWYDVGHTIGTIDDGDDDDDDDDTEEWLWQAYSYQEQEDKDRPLNLPPHIATGKIGN